MAEMGCPKGTFAKSFGIEEKPKLGGVREEVVE